MIYTSINTTGSFLFKLFVHRMVCRHIVGSVHCVTLSFKLYKTNIHGANTILHMDCQHLKMVNVKTCTEKA